VAAHVETKRVHPDAVINDLLWLFDGPRQREAQRLVREALCSNPFASQVDAATLSGVGESAWQVFGSWRVRMGSAKRSELLQLDLPRSFSF
jgi:hypothetical protein